MLFAALGKVRAGTVQERLARRAQWQPPNEVVAEYWLQTDNPHVILMIETDSFAQLMATLVGWDDVFDITVVPAITAEEGFEVVQQMLQE